MIKGFKCFRGEVDFDQCYECDRECFPRPYLDFVIHGAKQTRGLLSPSMVWNCPRNTLLNQYYDVYVKPEQRYWLFFGTLAHLIMEGWNRPDLIKEKRIKFNLGRFELSGQPDCLRLLPDGSYELIDFKTIKLISIDKEGNPKMEWLAKKEYQGQLSLYAHGLAQNGIKVSRAKLYYFARNNQDTYKNTTPTCLTVPITIDERLVQEAIERCEFVQGHYDAKTLPSIEDCQKEYRWKCQDYCEYYQKCMEVG